MVFGIVMLVQRLTTRLLCSELIYRMSDRYYRAFCPEFIMECWLRSSHHLRSRSNHC